MGAMANYRETIGEDLGAWMRGEETDGDHVAKHINASGQRMEYQLGTLDEIEARGFEIGSYRIDVAGWDYPHITLIRTSSVDYTPFTRDTGNFRRIASFG